MNILEDDNIPIRVSNVSKDEIVLSDGLVLPPNCLFLNGHIFTWNTPVVKMMEAMPNGRGWEGWTNDIWSIFETVTPRPGMCALLMRRYSHSWYWANGSSGAIAHPCSLELIGNTARCSEYGKSTI